VHVNFRRRRRPKKKFGKKRKKVGLCCQQFSNINERERLFRKVDSRKKGWERFKEHMAVAAKKEGECIYVKGKEQQK
jgi:hypothetical protein